MKVMLGVWRNQINFNSISSATLRCRRTYISMNEKHMDDYSDESIDTNDFDFWAYLGVATRSGITLEYLLF